MSQLMSEEKPVIEKIEDNIRRDIIASFREWLDKPETKVEGVERFWEYKSRLLLVEIDRLSSRVEELQSNLNKTVEAHCETQEWWRADAKKLIDLLSVVDDIQMHIRLDVIDGWACIPIGEWGNINRTLSTVAAGIRGKG